MADTPNYSFTLPTIGADLDTWGAHLNNNWSSLDTILQTIADAVAERPTVSETIDLIYPIGSIFINTIDVDPDAIFPGTTWERFATGRTIVGVGTWDGVAWTSEDTKGAAKVNLTTDQLPAHDHTVDPPSTTVTSGGNNRGHTHAVDPPGTNTTNAGTHNHGGSTGAGGRHIHRYYNPNSGSPNTVGFLNDYNGGVNYNFTFYDSSGNGFTIPKAQEGQILTDLWTSGPSNVDKGANHSHSISNDGVHDHFINIPEFNSGGESQNHTHEVTVNIGAFSSESTGAGDDVPIIQPSIGVFMWKRIA